MAFFTGLLRFRKWVILLVGIATLGAAWQVPRLRFETGMEAIIPMSDPVQTYNAIVEDHFGLGDPLIVGVLNENPAEDGVFNPRTLRLVHELSTQIARLPGIKASRSSDVASIATLDTITGTTDGLIVAPFMAAMPQTTAELAALQSGVFANPMAVNWLVSRDGTGLLIVAKMEPSDGTVVSVTRRETGYRHLQQLIDRYRASGTPEQFWVTGRGPMEVTYAEEVRHEIGVFALPMIVLIILTLWLTYRTWHSVILPLLVVGFALLWTFAVMALLGIPVDFVSTMMPVIVMTTGLAASIHILGGYYQALSAKPGWSSSAAVLAAMTTLWEPVVLASVTTTVGFLSFMTATLLPVQYFGLSTAVGFTASLFLSLTFLLAALSWCPPTPSPRLRATPDPLALPIAERWTTRLLTWLGTTLGHAPTTVVLVTAIVVSICAVGLWHLESNTSWIEVMHPDNPIRRADEVLRQKFHGTLPLYVVVAGTATDSITDPAVMEKLHRLQAEVEQDLSVGGSLSIAEFVAHMHRVMHEDRTEMERIPASRELSAHYLLLYSLSGDPTAFADLVDDAYQQATVVIFLRSDHTQDILRVVQRVEAFVTREFGPRIGVATHASTGTAICLDACVVMAGFGVLMCSQFSPNFYLGSMVALTLGACVLVTLTVLPALLAVMRPRFLAGAARPAPTQAPVPSRPLEDRVP